MHVFAMACLQVSQGYEYSAFHVLFVDHTWVLLCPQVPQGYDVMFYIVNAKNLPACDWWNGLADPYVIITAHVGGQQFQYK
jgi:hypothetical protein